jgi:hypothetical protein
MISGKITPEALYELVKPPVANFISFVNPRAYGNSNKSFLNSKIYKMNNIAPKHTEQLKEDFLSIAKGDEETVQATCIKSILNNEDVEKNLELIKHYILKTSSNFCQALKTQFATSKGFAKENGYYKILGHKNHHATEDGQPLINILKTETNSDDFGSPEFSLAKDELVSNISQMNIKYDQLAKEAFSKYKSAKDNK